MSTRLAFTLGAASGLALAAGWVAYWCGKAMGATE